ncbi:hypothetical protein [Acinetobacter rathckeae]|uniref:hypothetical protein n=1 Tax=Acinetobacter rathckeae TaxID=2605272 RepID=UPI0018A32FD0|nr:hypothetical protein [Acinetobacter rathckeae]MBF7687042.1 hypothetical protein [Acinetobacter rathckeae]MBF7696711.1 hypothetical protein [Acinetobacter rathckeae]
MSNYQQFNFNQDAAKKADGGGRIDQTGKYAGKISHVEFVTSNSGKKTQGLEFHFIADNDATTSFTIWTHQADGTPIFGFDKVNALLACAQIQTLTPTNRTLEKYSYDAGGKVKQPCTVAPELDNKPIGLLLQRENYQNQNGEWRYQMNFYAAFQYGTDFMAAEILDRAIKPLALEKVLNRLINVGDATRKSNNNNRPQHQQQNQGYNQPQQSQGYGNQPQPHDDDNLPF